MENINIKSDLEREIYENTLKALDSVLEVNVPLISNLSNFIAVIKDSFKKISWIGFYFLKEDKLYLGPFQGKIACTTIKVGSGVCGTVAEKKETLIVKNVHEFQGHIACDSGSNSEIVLPIIQNDSLVGVLDIDSYAFSAFSDSDKFYLEKMISLLTDIVHFNSLLFTNI